MSEPARIGAVYLEPRKAFADIVAHPQRWWIPIILIELVSIVFIYSYSQHVGWERMIRQSIESNSRVQSLPPEQREQAIDRGVKFAGVMGYVGAVLGTPIVMIVVAGVLMLVMNSIMGAQVRFAQSLAIVSYSFLPGVISGLLGIAVMYLKNPEDFDIRNPIAFNGGAFLSSTAPKWLSALASSVDLFSFWMMALMAVGYAATTKKMPWSRAFGGVLMMWVLWVIVKVGWNAMFS